MLERFFFVIIFIEILESKKESQMKISLLMSVFYFAGFVLSSNAQTNTIGFYDSVFVVSHPEVTRLGDSILTYYERTTLKTLNEMEKELERKKAYHELYKDSSYRDIGCRMFSLDYMEEILLSKKNSFAEDREIIRTGFQKLTLKNLNEILVIIAERYNLAVLADIRRSENFYEINSPDYTNEILTELIRRNNAPLVTK